MENKKIPKLTEEERRILADKHYWETCAGCGASEKEYYIKCGWAMLVFHPEPDMMLCEDCYADYPDEEENDRPETIQ